VPFPWYNVENIVERDRPQITIWRMRIACWILMATNSYSEYVTHIALPLQQWLHGRASMLRFTYFVGIVLLSSLSLSLSLSLFYHNLSSLLDIVLLILGIAFQRSQTSRSSNARWKSSADSKLPGRQNVIQMPFPPQPALTNIKTNFTFFIPFSAVTIMATIFSVA
jgi:hypothetical protein